MRGYAKDAAPRGKHAAKKARQGEGALDEEFDPAYDSEPDDCFDDAAPTAAPTAVKGKRALGPQARLEQTPDQGLVFWCALCNDKKPVQSTKATSRPIVLAGSRAAGGAVASPTPPSTSSVLKDSSPSRSHRHRRSGRPAAGVEQLAVGVAAAAALARAWPEECGDQGGCGRQAGLVPRCKVWGAKQVCGAGFGEQHRRPQREH